MVRRAGTREWDAKARRRRMVRGAGVVVGVGAIGFLSSHCAVRMPGASFAGPLPELSAPQKSLAEEMRGDVEVLAGRIGERNAQHAEKLAEAERYLTEQLRAAGYEVKRQAFVVKEPAGVEVANLEVEIGGGRLLGLEDSARPAEGSQGRAGETPAPQGMGREIVIVGAHYDSYRNCPAANDNGSGVAAVLALARRFAPGPGRENGHGSTRMGTDGSRDRLEYSTIAGTGASTNTDHLGDSMIGGTGIGGTRTLRFVFFVNEEPPYFWTSEMGSLVYAKACKERGERIAAMLSIETIGYYSEEKGSQDYPPVVGTFYPSEGDFIGFVGLYESKELVEECVGAFRAAAPFPSQGAALTALVPRVASSDHWSFWKMGYPALMVTDTAPYRYPHYHKPTDTAEKLDYERMARVVEGLEGVVEGLVSGEIAKGK